MPKGQRILPNTSAGNADEAVKHALIDLADGVIDVSRSH